MVSPLSAKAGLLDNLVGGLTSSVTGGTEVTIVSDQSETPTLLNSIKDLTDTFTDLQQNLENKEFNLDPLVYATKEHLTQQLQSELLKWLGGQADGQNGEIPFIQNFADYYQEAIEKAATEFIFGDGTYNQCSSAQTHELRTVLYNNFVQEYYDETSTNNQCSEADTLDNMDPGDVLYLAFRSCDAKNTSCQILKETVKLNNAIQEELAISKQKADLSGGFEPTEVCQDIPNASGSGSTQKCYITKPLSVDSHSASFLLGELPALQILDMDEFNEVASSFMTNLTNQVLQGAAGVLGLSGNPDYSVNLFGDSGDLSYADALAQDDVSKYQTSSASVIKNSLKAEKEYQELQQDILDIFDELDVKLTDNSTKFPKCFDLELTDELKTEKDNATTNYAVSSTTISILETLNTQYANATDSSTKLAVMNTYLSYKSQDLFTTSSKVNKLREQYLNIKLAALIDEFLYDIATKRKSCGGTFDYPPSS